MGDLPTFSDLQRIARDEILSRNTKLTLDVLDREGTDANAFVAAVAQVGDTLAGQLARIEAAQTLGSAKLKDLDRLVFDRYGLLRKAASPSYGSVQFTTASPNPSAFNIPVGTKLTTTEGLLFLTTASAVFPAAVSGPVTVAVISAAAGLGSQARADTITSIGSILPSSPANLAVSNPLATAGGDDSETDDQLRERARAFFTTARRGTVAAIQEVALGVPGVRNAVAFEVLDAFGRPAKSVQLVIADGFTETLAELDTVPPSYQTQSAVLADTVFQALADTRAAGVFVDIQLAKVVLQTVILALAFSPAVTNVDSIALQARARVAAFINSLKPGALLQRSAISLVLQGVPGLVIFGGEVLSPVQDVQAQQLEVLRTTLGLVVATTVQPDRALAGTGNPDAAGF